MQSVLKRVVDFNFSWKLGARFTRKFLKAGKVYRIPFGPLRSLKMVYDPKMNLHTLLGLSDLGVFRDLRKVFRCLPLEWAGGTAVDLGANRGLYSLWLAKSGFFSEVIGFEPHPKMVEQFKKNVSLNHLTEIEVVPKACADKVGRMEFILDESDHVSSLVSSETEHLRVSATLEVETISLDEFFQRRKRGPSFIKMDIEGGGIWAIPGFTECLSKFRPILYLESHSPGEDAAIGKILQAFSYEGFELTHRRWIEEPEKGHPDPKGTWGNVLCIPQELRSFITSL